MDDEYLPTLLYVYFECEYYIIYTFTVSFIQDKMYLIFAKKKGTLTQKRGHFKNLLGAWPLAPPPPRLLRPYG